MIGYPQDARDQWWQRQVDRLVEERDEARDELDRMRNALVRSACVLRICSVGHVDTAVADAIESALYVARAALGAEEEER